MTVTVIVTVYSDSLWSTVYSDSLVIVTLTVKVTVTVIVTVIGMAVSHFIQPVHVYSSPRPLREPLLSSSIHQRDIPQIFTDESAVLAARSAGRSPGAGPPDLSHGRGDHHRRAVPLAAAA